MRSMARWIRQEILSTLLPFWWVGAVDFVLAFLLIFAGERLAIQLYEVFNTEIAPSSLTREKLAFFCFVSFIAGLIGAVGAITRGKMRIFYDRSTAWTIGATAVAIMVPPSILCVAGWAFTDLPMTWLHWLHLAIYFSPAATPLGYRVFGFRLNGFKRLIRNHGLYGAVALMNIHARKSGDQYHYIINPPQ